MFGNLKKTLYISSIRLRVKQLKHKQMKKSVITTEKMRSILEGEFGYKPNQVMYQLFGQFIWFPTNEPMDLALPNKGIKMSELTSIFTETQLRNLINSKLNK